MSESQIIVDERVNKRDSEITDNNVVCAMKQMLKFMQRSSGEYLAVGTDDKARLLEVVYIYNALDDFFYVYHAQKVTTKTLKELGLT